MNRILVILLVLTGFFCTKAENLRGGIYDTKISPQMESFICSSQLLQKGIENRDRILIEDASEEFHMVESEELRIGEDFQMKCNDPNLIRNPEIIFNKEFCDSIEKNNFILVERDPLMIMREIPGNENVLNLISRSILPGGEAVFSISGEGRMEMVVPMSIVGGLKVELNANGEKIPLEADNTFPYIAWELEPDSPTFEVIVSNPTEDKISFCIAVN